MAAGSSTGRGQTRHPMPTGFPSRNRPPVWYIPSYQTRLIGPSFLLAALWARFCHIDQRFALRTGATKLTLDLQEDFAWTRDMLAARGF